ncbi:hypothetical protein ACLK2H_02525 [Escherichia coli]
MFGKLTLDAVPFHEPIVMVTVAAIIIGGLALLQPDPLTSVSGPTYGMSG